MRTNYWETTLFEALPTCAHLINRIPHCPYVPRPIFIFWNKVCLSLSGRMIHCVEKNTWSWLTLSAQWTALENKASSSGIHLFNVLYKDWGSLSPGLLSWNPAYCTNTSHLVLLVWELGLQRRQQGNVPLSLKPLLWGINPVSDCVQLPSRGHHTVLWTGAQETTVGNVILLRARLPVTEQSHMTYSGTSVFKQIEISDPSQLPIPTHILKASS